MSQLRFTNEKIFDESEENLIKKHYQLLKDSKSSHIIIDKLIRCIFLNLPILKEQFLKFLSNYYTLKFGPKIGEGKEELLNLKECEQQDLFSLVFILTKSIEDPSDPYFHKNMFYILYDIIKGKVGSFDEKFLDFDTIKWIFNFMVRSYIDRHLDREAIMNNFDEDKLLGFLKRNLPIEVEEKFQNKNNLFKEEEDEILPVEKTILDQFLSKLPNLDSFLKNCFHLRCLLIDYDTEYMSSMPLLHEEGGALTTELFFFYILSNPHIYFQKFGFKLFDSKKDGLSIPNSIYSFMGFTNPITIFLHHWEKEENREYIIGAFISGKLRESSEKFSGDENSFIFSLLPKFEIYHFKDNPDKIAYFLTKCLPNLTKNPGIGLGEYVKDNEEFHRLWIDAKDTSHKSYFLKFDRVFQDGSPFNETQKFLNIFAIEIFGFGTEDDVNALRKKQGKDKIYFEKMKKVDKKWLADADFDKQVFLGDTFAHQQYGRRGSLDINSREEDV
jgi:hypothetical protein